MTNVMIRIFCALWTDCEPCNKAFIQGISATVLKKDNVSKHMRTDMHAKACNMARQPTFDANRVGCNC